MAAPYGGGEREPAGEPGAPPATVSEIEVLRHRDVARMSEAERREVHRLLALLRGARQPRRSRRYRPSPHGGATDARRTVREILRHGGEPARLRRRVRRDRPRRVVMLVDVSGSMAAYADTLLRLAHALVRAEPGATEVFSMGTRLTRITAALRHRDPGLAMDECSAAIPDWSGGTRLGEEVRALLRLPDPRGAIVVIASDGWERGRADLLGAQMARLSRLARRVVWVNPHKGDPAYRPLTAGIRAALPYVTDFVAGHSLAAYEELAALLAGDRPVRPVRPVRGCREGRAGAWTCWTRCCGGGSRGGGSGSPPSWAPSAARRARPARPWPSSTARRPAACRAAASRARSTSWPRRSSPPGRRCSNGTA
ncbi:hypothetical protein B1L11_30215 [Microbispora sp. GKU 823]|nr:hypothetical protein B1L11_30215 [Microbispora sp. GKU 823]